MKKILTISLLSLLAFKAFSDSPHITPALGCPANQICCPISITCDYLLGCGDTENFNLDGQSAKPFTGLQTFNLNLIEALHSNSTYFQMDCMYTNNIMLQSSQSGTLSGAAWQYRFMKDGANCLTKNSLDCTEIPHS